MFCNSDQLIRLKKFTWRRVKKMKKRNIFRVLVPNPE
jgi:hypothetical protein